MLDPIALLAQADPSNPLGEGRIDNTIVDPEVHLVWGVVVLVTMVVAAVWLVVLAVRGRTVTRGPRLALIGAQVALMVQVLLGIKLLDQGMGVVQLYIHYVGGALPLGLFLAAGWVDWRSDRTRTRALAVLTSLGLLSATMAFFIGRAYVESGG